MDHPKKAGDIVIVLSGTRILGTGRINEVRKDESRFGNYVYSYLVETYGWLGESLVTSPNDQVFRMLRAGAERKLRHAEARQARTLEVVDLVCKSIPSRLPLAYEPD